MKKNLIYALLCAILSLNGCDKIKEVTSKDFTVNNINLDFTAVTENMPALSNSSADVSMRAAAAAMSTFSVTRTVDISELGSSELAEYASKISKVVVNAATVSVTTNPSGNYTVSNLKISATGVSGSLEIPSYTIGSAFTAPSNMNSYLANLLLKLTNDKKVTVTVSGQTDALPGTTIKVSYESDVLFTASLF